MAELNRSVAPMASPLERIPFPEVEIIHLNNGIPLYYVPFGSQEVLDLRLVFPGGKSFERQNGVASMVAGMLQEGTRNYTGLELAQKTDELGSFIGVSSGYESVTLRLTTLSRHLEKVMHLVQEISLYPTFPEEDLGKMISRKIQNLEVESQKTGYIARKEFGRLMFGDAHPYGMSTEKKDLELISSHTLRDFHASQYQLEKAFFVASGRFSIEVLTNSLNEFFGNQALSSGHTGIKWSGSGAAVAAAVPQSGMHYFEKPDSMQATVRVGHKGFSRSHPDFYPMQVVNTLLGGYFGSRLMRNIREEKGYTYGIGSGWLSMKYDGMFIVQTDVGNEYIKPTLDEIKKEIRLLIEKGTAPGELALVKNYMAGKSVSRRETPSQIGELVVTALVNEIDFSSLDEKFDLIMGVSEMDVKRLAAEYLKVDQLLEVVCGKM